MTSAREDPLEHLPRLLAAFAGGVPGVDYALVVSREHLLLAWSPEVDRAVGDQSAAVVGGMWSLATNAAQSLARGEGRYCLVRMSKGELHVVPVGDRAVLVVMAGKEAEQAVIAREAGLLAERAERLLVDGSHEQLQEAAAGQLVRGAR